MKSSRTWKILSTVDVSTEMYVADEFEDVRVDVKPGISKEELLNVIENYNGIIAGDIIEYDAEIFEKAKNLKIVTRFGVGVDNVNLEDAEKYDVMVTNVPGENAKSVAEHTIGLMIAASKNFSVCDKEMREGNWKRALGTGRELAGKTLGQIGFGRIGSLVAEKCRLAFGMKVLVHDPYLPKFEVENRFGKKVNLDELLNKSDVISVNAPLTEETEGLLGKEEFKKMKNSVILVNTGRGKIVKENELAEAIKEEEIFGAGLDVMRNEPVAEGNPIFELDHVVVTPHCASATFESRERVFRTALEEQITAFEGGRPQFLHISD